MASEIWHREENTRKYETFAPKLQNVNAGDVLLVALNCLSLQIKSQQNI